MVSAQTVASQQSAPFLTDRVNRLPYVQKNISRSIQLTTSRSTAYPDSAVHLHLSRSICAVSRLSDSVIHLHLSRFDQPGQLGQGHKGMSLGWMLVSGDLK